MKKIVLTLAVALVSTMMLTAQPPQCGNDEQRPPMAPEKMVEQRVERLDKELSLSDYQKQEISKIYKQEMENMKPDAPAPEKDGKKERPDDAAMKAHHEKMKAQHEATEAQVEALLTDEQKTKYAEMKKRHDRPGGHGKHHGMRGGDQMGGPQGNGCGCCCNKGDRRPEPPTQAAGKNN